MKKKLLLIHAYYILSSYNIYSMKQRIEKPEASCFPTKQLSLPQNLSNQEKKGSNENLINLLTTQKNLKSEQADFELKIIQEEQQKKLMLLKLSTVILTTLTSSAFIAKTMQHQPKTRFISEALTTSHLIWNACQGAAGCMAVGIAYYQIHKLIYRGCVSKEEFKILEKAYKSNTKKLDELGNIIKKQANDHNEDLNMTRATFQRIIATQADLIRVTNAHAEDLDKKRICITEVATSCDSLQKAINNHAKLIKEQNNSCQPLTVNEDPAATSCRTSEPAAIPKRPSYYNSSIPQASNAAMTFFRKEKTSCPCRPCCNKKSTAIKEPK